MDEKINDLNNLYLIISQMNRLANERDSIDNSIRDRAFSDEEYRQVSELQDQIDRKREDYISRRGEFASKFSSTAEVEQIKEMLENKKDQAMKEKGFFDYRKYSELIGILEETKQDIHFAQKKTKQDINCSPDEREDI